MLKQVEEITFQAHLSQGILPEVPGDWVRTYKEAGALHIKGLFDPQEVQAWQKEAARLTTLPIVKEKYNIRTDWCPESGDFPWKIDPFLDLSPLFTQLAYDPRLVAVLRALFDGENPKIFKDKLIYKPPHAHGGGLHQDYNWWQGFPTSLLSVMIGVDAATRENGCTEVWPGSHHTFLGKNDGTIIGYQDEWADAYPHLYMETEPGDVLIFHCFTLHASGENKTDGFRKQMFLTYNPESEGDLHARHYAHYENYVKAARDQGWKDHGFMR